MSNSIELMNQTETTYSYIKTRILEGILKPSEKLVESQLAKEIGVSRNTLKNALLILEKENLVEIEKNKGAKVKAFTLDEITNFLDIREALEGVIVKSVAVHITDESICELESILNKMEALIKDNKLDEYSQMNRAFHDIIYKSSKNQQAVDLVLMIKAQLMRYQFRTILVPGRTDNSLQEHKEIFNALKLKDGERAEVAIKKHISHVKETIENYFQFLI